MKIRNIMHHICFVLLTTAMGTLIPMNAVCAIVDDPTVASKPLALMVSGEPNADYDFQGEFVGEIRIDKDVQAVGLQIVAQGNQTYSAAQFVGGLPGDGWNGEQPIRMTGVRTENVLVLSGSDLALLSKRDRCLVINSDGRKIGLVKRVNRVSPTLGAKPVRGAVVLFNGENTDQFSTAQMTEDGLLMQGADVKPMFQDFNLHAEFQLSFMPNKTGQQRSNSGLYLQSRYEVQVLDSFGLDPLINGCGSLYQFRAPDLNMCLPPLTWQTYDIVFTSPRFNSDGKKSRPARITVWLNGVKVQNNVKLENSTGNGQREAPTLLPIRFQNHNDEVRFQNVWIVDRGLHAPRKFPAHRTNERKPAVESKPSKKS